MIRPATPKDASRLAEIQIFAKRKAYRPIFQNDIVSFHEMQVLPLASFYQDTEGALKDIFVFDDSIIKGMMIWNCHTPDLWELKELYVDPFFQGEGIGTALIKNFMATAQSHHVKEAYLMVLEENLSAQTFYQRLGFLPSGIRKEFGDTGKYLLEYKITLESPVL